jgi:hypothetical protein
MLCCELLGSDVYPFRRCFTTLKRHKKQKRNQNAATWIVVLRLERCVRQYPARLFIPHQRKLLPSPLCDAASRNVRKPEAKRACPLIKQCVDAEVSPLQRWRSTAVRSCLQTSSVVALLFPISSSSLLSILILPFLAGVHFLVAIRLVVYFRSAPFVCGFHFAPHRLPSRNKLHHCTSSFVFVFDITDNNYCPEQRR